MPPAKKPLNAPLKNLLKNLPPMQTRLFGRHKDSISIIGLGGSHIGGPELSSQAAIRIMRTALDHGLNFFDNCWDYKGGRSEERMGKALADGYRARAFVMTKIDARDKKTALRQLDQSLQRLKLEQIDLIQHHEVIRYDDVDRIFGEGGAMDALIEARERGKVRYIGFTGHKDPSIHLYMLDLAARRGIDFDAVQMPLNVMDAHFRSFEKEVLPRALTERIAVLGMKSLGGGALLKAGNLSAAECLRYSLSLPAATVITGIDSFERLTQALHLGAHFTPMQPEEISALLAQTKAPAAEGRFELFKTTSHYDATAREHQWLGEDPSRVEELTR
jgi:aryl-alcohol dehydrogenase-like predicted oxidoreductase